MLSSVRIAVNLIFIMVKLRIWTISYTYSIFYLYVVDLFYHRFFESYIQSFFRSTESGESIWKGGTDLPNPKTEVMAANLDEAVYVIGGFTFDGKITNIVEMYNSTNNTWVQNMK